MRSVGFIISHKENEYRRALLLDDLKKINHKEYLFFQSGYGLSVGITDEELINAGCHIADRVTILKKDVICDPKAGDGDYLSQLNSNQILFGWIHATQNYNITQALVDSKVTVFAWEKMYHSGRHIFWRNNEIAGEAAIMHAFQRYGRMPYGCKVAVIGKGNVAQGAMKILTLLGADVTIYDRKTESLIKHEYKNYDVIVNALLWDVNRKDHILYREDLKSMKKGALIIDISCDRAGAIESCIPTTIEDPVYFDHDIMHYCVDHTPSLFYKTATIGISKAVCHFIDDFITGNEMNNEILEKALILRCGKIIDKEIEQYQNR